MGCGTFIAGRVLSSARRSSTATADEIYERSRASAQASFWDVVLLDTVLGHPEVQRSVDEGMWANRINTRERRVNTWAAALGVVLWIGGTFVWYTTIGGRDMPDGALGSMLLGFVVCFIAAVIVAFVIATRWQKRFIRGINAQFARQAGTSHAC